MGYGADCQGPRSGRDSGQWGSRFAKQIGGTAILDSRRAPMPEYHDTQREEIARDGVRCPVPRSM